jgi:hypothetical protein
VCEQTYPLGINKEIHSLRQFLPIELDITANGDSLINAGLSRKSFKDSMSKRSDVEVLNRGEQCRLGRQHQLNVVGFREALQAKSSVSLRRHIFET